MRARWPRSTRVWSCCFIFERTKMNATQWMNRVIKPAVFVLCLLPLAWLGWDAYMHQLGANPVEKMSHRTGEWAFKLLLMTLTVTPLRKLTGWNSVIRLRRMLGLYTFFYAGRRGRAGRGGERGGEGAE